MMWLEFFWLSAKRVTLLLLAPALVGCESIEATRHEAEFDPPRTYMEFMGGRFPESAVSEEMVARGVDFTRKLGFDLEFEAAVNSEGCKEICFVYRHRNIDDIYVVLTADKSQTRFRRWFHFSPLDSGSPKKRDKAG